VSKKLPKPLRVLIVDDDKSFVDCLQRDANPHRIILEHANSLEEAVQIFDAKGEKAFVGIIFDVICLKFKDQKVPDESFISKAKEVFDQKAPALPKVILTAEPKYFETLKPFYKGTLQVFLKGSGDLGQMFSYFVAESSKLEHLQIASQYPEVFIIFEKGFLDKKAEHDLITCLKFMHNSNPSMIADNLARLRRMQETIYLALNNKGPDLVSSDYIYENGTKCRPIIRYLKYKQLIEHGKIIDIASNLVHSIGSDYGTHVPIDPLYSPTKYTVQMTTFAILDLLLWFKEIMTSLQDITEQSATHFAQGPQSPMMSG